MQFQIVVLNFASQTREQPHDFIDLSLAIPEKENSSLKLEDCLEDFTGEEELTGVRCDHCIYFRHESRRKPLADVLDGQRARIRQKIKDAHIPELGVTLTKKGEESGKTDSIRIPAGVSEWSLPVTVNATKQLLIQEPPSALCLHLQRLITGTAFISLPSPLDGAN